jgi:broad specificity phosphatase PhoE
VEWLLLARHAFADSNRDGLASCEVPGQGLTAGGLEQARALGGRLAGDEISLGVSSELARTQETLRLALGGRTVPTVVLPELNEIDFGSFDSGPLDTYRAWAAAHPPALRPPGGGESRADAAARFARALGIVLARDADTILLVGHALFIRYTLDAAQGLVPAPVMTPVDHAVPHLLRSEEVEAAASRLDEWSRAPRFRDHPIEGGLPQ